MFRRHPYAITADVENMFHQFAIRDEQKTYLYVFWFKDNDPDAPLIEWWSKVHLIGLNSSPAIANTGIRFAVRQSPPANGDQWIKEDDLLDPIHLNPILPRVFFFGILPRGGKICPTRSKIFFLISIANFSIFQKCDVFSVENDGLEYSYDISIVKLVKNTL